MRKTRLFIWLWLAAVVVTVSGCDKLVIFNSKGPIGIAERDVIIIAFVLMLIVVIPVIIMALWFAYHYREGNTRARYDPGFTHSNKLEFVLWGIPIVIVLFLAWVAYKGSHELDPYRPLESSRQPVNVQVVALNWKWLFIYPDEGIATVNELYFPKGVPVNFRITSDAPMNSFFIPQLGGQIYAMAGMQTQLHLQADEAGVYRGMSSNYSGAGFAGMHFLATATEDRAGFNAWVQKVRASGQVLNEASYHTLVQDSKFVPVTYYAEVEPGLFQQIMGKFNSGHGMNHASQAHGSGYAPQMTDMSNNDARAITNNMQTQF